MYTGGTVEYETSPSKYPDLALPLLTPSLTFGLMGSGGNRRRAHCGVTKGGWMVTDRG